MPFLLNLGAGSLQPLQTSDLANIDELRDWEIINLDIYNQLVVYSPDRSKMPFPDANIVWSDVEKAIDLGDGAVDIAVAVSPYNYAALNKEVYRVLKTGGLAIIMGNKKNKFANKKNSFCGPVVAQKFEEWFEAIEPPNEAVKCIEFLAKRGSYVTSGASETTVDVSHVFRKK